MGERSSRGQGRLSSGAGFPGHPASQAERAGGHGGEIRSHNIGLGPSPPQTFHRGWGSWGQLRGLERIPAADPTAQGTLLPALLPDPSAPRTPGCRHCWPRSKPLPGAQEGSRADNCPPLPFPAPLDPVLARAAAPAREGGQSGAPEPRAALASLTVSSRLESLAPPARSAPTPAAPPARPLRGPCAAALSPARLGALSSGSARHRGGRRLFLLQPPPRPSPDVRRGLEGGPRRPAREGLRPAGPLRAPRSVPASCPCPAGRAREPRALRGSGGGTGRDGRRALSGEADSPASPKCLPGPPRAARPGSGGASGRVCERGAGEPGPSSGPTTGPAARLHGPPWPGRPLSAETLCAGFSLHRHGDPLSAPCPAPSSRGPRAAPGKDSSRASGRLTIGRSPDVQMKGAEGSHAADLPPSEPPVSAHGRS